MGQPSKKLRAKLAHDASRTPRMNSTRGAANNLSPANETKVTGAGGLRDFEAAAAIRSEGWGTLGFGDKVQRIGVIIPTYKRDSALESTLLQLSLQTVLPSEVVVVDNADSDTCRAMCLRLSIELPFELTYMPSSQNRGPAGATLLGMEHLLPRLDDNDWIARGDDDSPTVSTSHFRRMLDVADVARTRTPMLGGIGRSGAKFDYRTGLLSKPLATEDRLVLVDYLATNSFPLFSVSAVRRMGGFRDDLFFGHTEVEYGLRMRRAGYHLYRYDAPGAKRTRRRRSLSVTTPTWRGYYSLRNHVVIVREYCGTFVTLRVIIIALAKPLLNVLVRPRAALETLRLNWQAVSDALTGRMGRTIEPSVRDGELDRRGA